MTHVAAPTITADLDQVLATIRLWLTPTVEGQCSQPDAVKLRVLLANLNQIRIRVSTAEADLPPGESLSLALEQMHDDLGACARLDVQLTRNQLLRYTAALADAAAWAWALELSLALATGQNPPHRIPELMLARKLSKAGVTVGMPGASGTHGLPDGGAA